MKNAKLFKIGALVLIYGISYLCSDDASEVNPSVSSGDHNASAIVADSFTMTIEEKRLWVESIKD